MTLTTLQLSDADARIGYRERGRGDPLVLVHGVGMQSAAWGPQIDALSKTHRVIALDLPGHGQSSPLEPGAELTDFVDWLYRAVHALDLGAVNLAGHSLGALIAGGFAITYPELTKRVAVINGVYCRTEEARAAVERRADEIRAGSPDLETPLNRWFGDSREEDPVRAKVRGWLLSVDTDGYATAYGAFARGDRIYAHRWPEVYCPMLALTGDGDPNSTPEMSRAMAVAARNGHTEILAGHRHMVNLTAPDQVNAILKAWLEQPAILEETA